ncbi:MAG: SLC13 family permease [Oscillospiraceae bacterium]
MDGLTNKAKIQWAIVVASIIIILLIPTTETFTVVGRTFLAITVPAILCMVFSLLNNAVIAILLPILYVTFGVLEIAQAYNSWTGNVVWSALGCFIISNAMERTGLMKRISYRCILWTGASYKGIVYGLIIAGFIINIITAGSTGLVFATMAFSYSLCKSFGLGKSKASCGIMLAGMIGMITVGHFIYTPASIGVLLSGAGENVAKPGYIQFFLQNAIFIPLLFILGFMITKVMKPEKEINGKEYFQQQREALGKMTKEEIKLSVLLIVLVLALITEPLHHVSQMAVLLIVPMLMYLPGINVGKAEDIKKVNFSTILFIAGCLSIGTAARASGLATLISNAIFPLVSNLSPWTLIGAIWIFGFIINFLLTPLAAMSAFSAPVSEIAASLGVSPLPVLYSFFQGLDNLIMPYERSFFLVCYGYDVMSLKDFAKVMAWKSLIGFAYIMIIGVPYWKLIGLF